MATRSLYRFDSTSIPIPCQGLLIEEVGDDVVIYEPTSKIAHAVNSAAASVLVLCDGKTSVAEIVHELTESRADSGWKQPVKSCHAAGGFPSVWIKHGSLRMNSYRWAALPVFPGGRVLGLPLPYQPR